MTTTRTVASLPPPTLCQPSLLYWAPEHLPPSCRYFLFCLLSPFPLLEPTLRERREIFSCFIHCCSPTPGIGLALGRNGNNNSGREPSQRRRSALRRCSLSLRSYFFVHLGLLNSSLERVGPPVAGRRKGVMRLRA